MTHLIRHASRLVLIAALAAGAAGCQFIVTLPKDLCATNKDCAEGQSCVAGTCKANDASCTPNCEGRTCGSDGCNGFCGACSGKGETCDNAVGQCVASCNSGASCPGGSECNPNTGICTCTESSCAAAGLHCNEAMDKTCTQCATNEHCDNGQACVGGKCVACSSDGQCGGAAPHCAKGKCVQCAEDDHCPVPQALAEIGGDTKWAICVNNQCGLGMCAAGDPDNRCLKDSTDRPACKMVPIPDSQGETYQVGLCTRCTTDGECAEGSTCDVDEDAFPPESQCRPTDDGRCGVDADCNGSPFGQVCRSGFCGCETNQQCVDTSSICDNVARASPGMCAKCTATNVSTCPLGARACKVDASSAHLNQCVECVKNENCDSGEYCDLASNECKPSPECGASEYRPLLGESCQQATAPNVKCSEPRGQGRCVRCTQAVDCNGGTCNADGSCSFRDGFCALSLDCATSPAGGKCVNVPGVSSTKCGCDGDGDCGAGKLCNPTTKQCAECFPRTAQSTANLDTCSASLRGCSTAAVCVECDENADCATAPVGVTGSRNFGSAATCDPNQNVCTCTPKTPAMVCGALPAGSCGTQDDGCGGTINCGCATPGYLCNATNNMCAPGEGISCEGGNPCADGLACLGVTFPGSSALETKLSHTCVRITGASPSGPGYVTRTVGGRSYDFKRCSKDGDCSGDEFCATDPKSPADMYCVAGCKLPANPSSSPSSGSCDGRSRLVVDDTQPRGAVEGTLCVPGFDGCGIGLTCVYHPQSTSGGVCSRDCPTSSAANECLCVPGASARDGACAYEYIPGTSCDYSTTPCASGSHCEFKSGWTTGRCRADVNPAQCVDTSDCIMGTVCDPGTSKCIPLCIASYPTGTPLANLTVGENLIPRETCAPRSCSTALAAGWTEPDVVFGLCTQRATNTALGGRCGWDVSVRECASGLGCDTSLPERNKGNGDDRNFRLCRMPCAVNTSCSSGTACIVPDGTNTNGVCAIQGTAASGDPCDSSDDCQSGLACLKSASSGAKYGKCKPLCDPNATYAPLLCTVGACTRIDRDDAQTYACDDPTGTTSGPSWCAAPSTSNYEVCNFCDDDADQSVDDALHSAANIAAVQLPTISDYYVNGASVLIDKNVVSDAVVLPGDLVNATQPYTPAFTVFYILDSYVNGTAYPVVRRLGVAVVYPTAPTYPSDQRIGYSDWLGSPTYPTAAMVLGSGRRLAAVWGGDEGGKSYAYVAYQINVSNGIRYERLQRGTSRAVFDTSWAPGWTSRFDGGSATPMLTAARWSGAYESSGVFFSLVETAGPKVRARSHAYIKDVTGAANIYDTMGVTAGQTSSVPIDLATSVHPSAGGNKPEYLVTLLDKPTTAGQSGWNASFRSWQVFEPKIVNGSSLSGLGAPLVTSDSSSYYQHLALSQATTEQSNGTRSVVWMLTSKDTAASKPMISTYLYNGQTSISHANRKWGFRTGLISTGHPVFYSSVQQTGRWAMGMLDRDSAYPSSEVPTNYATVGVDGTNATMPVIRGHSNYCSGATTCVAPKLVAAASGEAGTAAVLEDGAVVYGCQ